ncbi:MAG: hypothetical protein ACE5GJ_00760 [Gemmatimonadota bacterium]
MKDRTDSNRRRAAGRVRRRALALALLAATAAVWGCARTRATSFPPPARPGVLVPTGFEATFASLAGLLESRGFPVLVSDHRFGNLITDWVFWEPGEVDLRAIADCDLPPNAPVSRARARFAFEVRPRANRAFVTILTQFQIERHPGFDKSSRGFVDCRSTGEWERNIAEALTRQLEVVR